MPPKRKPENRGLPARWQFTHGAYYYFVPRGLEAMWDGKKRFRLGSALHEAYKVWADRVGRNDKRTRSPICSTATRSKSCRPKRRPPVPGI